MSPLKIALLLRMYAHTKPNADLPEAQAFAPAMGQALDDFIAAGWVIKSATLEGLRHKAMDPWLTEAGVSLVEAIKGFGTAAERQAAVRATLPAPTRPAPPMPKIKPARPDYEAMLRDEFAMAAMQGAAASTMRYSSHMVAAIDAYKMADAMMEARNANR